MNVKKHSYPYRDLGIKTYTTARCFECGYRFIPKDKLLECPKCGTVNKYIDFEHENYIQDLIDNDCPVYDYLF